MKTVIVITVPMPKCPQVTINVKSELSFQEIREICSTVSPRFEISARPYYKELDGSCVDLETACQMIKNLVVTHIDNFNYEEIDTWHIVPDGDFTYPEFKKGACKVENGILYQCKKQFQRVPIKYTLKNVADGTWKTFERI